MWSSLEKGLTKLFDGIGKMDVGGLASSLSGLIIKALDAMDRSGGWETIGRKIGEFLGGIKWAEIVTKVLSASWKMISAGVESFFSSASGADLLAAIGTIIAGAAIKHGVLSIIIKGIFSGATAGAAVLMLLVGKDAGLGTNSLYEGSIWLSMLVEVILTFIFVFAILGVTSKESNSGVAGIVIGLTLTLVHIFGIHFTGTSVNPARSFGPALLMGGDAIKCVWVFILAPLVGGVLAFVYSTEVKYVMFSVGVTVLLIITGFIAMLLTKRWDHTFDRHIEYAKGCYRLVHQSLFPDDLDDEDENNEDAAASEWINGVNGLPAYAFRPKNPESKHDSGPVAAMANYVYSTFRTRRLFKYFYWLIQLVLIASMVYFLTQM
jgi:hypothetical protein